MLPQSSEDNNFLVHQNDFLKRKLLQVELRLFKCLKDSTSVSDFADCENARAWPGLRKQASHTSDTGYGLVGLTPKDLTTRSRHPAQCSPLFNDEDNEESLWEVMERYDKVSYGIECSLTLDSHAPKFDPLSPITRNLESLDLPSPCLLTPRIQRVTDGVTQTFVVVGKVRSSLQTPKGEFTEDYLPDTPNTFSFHMDLASCTPNVSPLREDFARRITARPRKKVLPRKKKKKLRTPTPLWSKQSSRDGCFSEADKSTFVEDNDGPFEDACRLLFSSPLRLLSPIHSDYGSENDLNSNEKGCKLIRINCETSEGNLLQQEMTQKVNADEDGAQIIIDEAVFTQLALTSTPHTSENTVETPRISALKSQALDVSFEDLRMVNPDDLMTSNYDDDDDDANKNRESLSISEQVSLMLNDTNDHTDHPVLEQNLVTSVNDTNQELGGDFYLSLPIEVISEGDIVQSQSGLQNVEEMANQDVGLSTDSFIFFAMDSADSIVPCGEMEDNTADLGNTQSVANAELMPTMQEAEDPTPECDLAPQFAIDSSFNLSSIKTEPMEEIPLLQATDPQSLLEVFEANQTSLTASKDLIHQPVQETVALNFAPCTPPQSHRSNKDTGARIIDSLPKELIEKIKASSKKRSTKMITEEENLPPPIKKRGRKAKQKSPASDCSKSSDSKLSTSAEEQDDLDHNYCLSPIKIKTESKVETFSKIPDYFSVSLSPNQKKIPSLGTSTDLARKDICNESTSASNLVSDLQSQAANIDPNMYSKLPDYITDVSNSCITIKTEVEDDSTMEDRNYQQQNQPKKKRKLKLSEYRMRRKAQPPPQTQSTLSSMPEIQLDIKPEIKQEPLTPKKTPVQALTPESPEVKILAIKEAPHIRAKRERNNKLKNIVGDQFLSRMPTTSLGHSLLHSSSEESNQTFKTYSPPNSEKSYSYSRRNYRKRDEVDSYRKWSSSSSRDTSPYSPKRNVRSYKMCSRSRGHRKCCKRWSRSPSYKKYRSRSRSRDRKRYYKSRRTRSSSYSSDSSCSMRSYSRSSSSSDSSSRSRSRSKSRRRRRRRSSSPPALPYERPSHPPPHNLYERQSYRVTHEYERHSYPAVPPYERPSHSPSPHQYKRPSHPSPPYCERVGGLPPHHPYERDGHPPPPLPYTRLGVPAPPPYHPKYRQRPHAPRNGDQCVPHQPEIYRQKMNKQLEERRVVYVGSIPEKTSRDELRERFKKFGTIVEVSVHFRDSGDHYGFVAYKEEGSATEAIKHANDDPNLPSYNLCYGNRRQFCGAEYQDLDAVEESSNQPTSPQYLPPLPTRQPVPKVQSAPQDFDSLLKDALRAKQ